MMVVSERNRSETDLEEDLEAFVNGPQSGISLEPKSTEKLLSSSGLISYALLLSHIPGKASVL
jgi:hypothetical protein